MFLWSVLCFLPPIKLVLKITSSLREMFLNISYFKVKLEMHDRLRAIIHKGRAFFKVTRCRRPDLLKPRSRKCSLSSRHQSVVKKQQLWMSPAPPSPTKCHCCSGHPAKCRAGPLLWVRMNLRQTEEGALLASVSKQQQWDSDSGLTPFNTHLIYQEYVWPCFLDCQLCEDGDFHLFCYSCSQHTLQCLALRQLTIMLSELTRWMTWSLPTHQLSYHPTPPLTCSS